ncbi:DRTGG domain-containing protein [Candidatus Aminicenantes bacterium AC-335-B20]|jgi:serine kinase of HPr protein (carbohydrate metabolism regulator)|nr:DRTGG domain-containing protein [SCandidatus Aminicenantes bacterium Aminicenantia_JdfR_composite]MCP2596602.1 DRTGG domain-containing protein [Candidatus Aminicenantes bacterium AC-335-G13]MCP2598072.1 DRTGG domain-containing protein [Candidatus Aminicenantes bacterium AC-335-L06]MCP2598960.1 DRTGG domain-containing protein [Candidatus Aminicenantes bacterium AC-335-B20]MCP2605790.1 DRTGG domain-containing protein [Candidatus Aminicenantes bacterium AC-335-O07]MCP2606312.1 DRTGG domain-con
MKLKEIVEKLNLTIIAGKEKLENEVTGGYASDLLSDVIANSKEGNLWLTLQTHQNIIAVATLKELAGIVIVNNREPDEETVRKAEQEKIPLLGSKLTAFELAGKLYELGIKG